MAYKNRAPELTLGERRKLVRKIARWLRKGYSIRDSAGLEGVSPRTLYEWAHSDPWIRKKITRARTYAKTPIHVSVVKGTKKDPRLAFDVLKYMDAQDLRMDIEDMDVDKGQQLVDAMQEYVNKKREENNGEDQ